MHELLHLFHVDLPLRNLANDIQAQVARPLSGMWGQVQSTSLSVTLAEAYTDAIACVVFCGLVRARLHAVKAAARVLAHFGMGKWLFSESSHVFSYYVVKAAMLVNTKAFVTLIRSNGLTPKDPLQVVSFMEASLRSPVFRAAVGAVSSRQSRDVRMTDLSPSKVSFSQLQLLNVAF